MLSRKEDSNKLTLRPIPSVLKNDILPNNILLNSAYCPDTKKQYVVAIKAHKIVYFPVSFSSDIPKGCMKMPNALISLSGYSLTENYTVELIELQNRHGNRIKQIKIELQQVTPSFKIEAYQIDLNVLKKIFIEVFKYYPVSLQQPLYIPWENVYIQCQIVMINQLIEQNELACYYLDEQSIIEFISAIKNNFKLINFLPSHSNPNVKVELLEQTAITLDFKTKGIGGYRKELDKIIREIFYSYALGNENLQAYGVQHTKGILLYGPPGTGKTLMAQKIAELACEKSRIKIVNGSEIKSPYVGESVKNLHRVFAGALQDWQEFGIKSPRHVIIFDEFDALAPERGVRNGTGVNEDLLGELLTITSGIDSPMNILVIAITNRKDLIDAALLRPERFEVHVELGLPIEEDRFEILSIKTNTMRESGLLAPDVDLRFWAKQTINYTGAELTKLVKNATQYAMKNNFTEDNDAELTLKRNIEVAGLAKVTKKDFVLAFSQMSPSFGTNKVNYNFNPEQFISVSLDRKLFIKQFKIKLEQFKKNKKNNRWQLLLTGKAGTGKTSLAKYLAHVAEVKYIKVISSTQLQGLPLHKQIQMLDEEITAAKHSELSIIILDEIEFLLEADATYLNYNNLLRLKLESFLKDPIQTGNKLIIIATCKNQNFLNSLGLKELFHETFEVKPITIQYHSSESLNLLISLAHSLEYRVNDFKPNPTDKRMLTLTLRQLIFHIQNSVQDERLDLNQFYESCADKMTHEKEKMPDMTDSPSSYATSFFGRI